MIWPGSASVSTPLSSNTAPLTITWSMPTEPRLTWTRPPAAVAGSDDRVLRAEDVLLHFRIMVAVDRLKTGLQILVERKVEKGIHDALVLLLGDLLDALALEVAVLSLRGHEHLDEVPAPVEQAAPAAAPVGHPAFLRDRAFDRLGRHRPADFRVAEGAHAVLIRERHDLVPGRHAAEEALGMGDVLVLRHVEAALQVEDRAGDGRQARAVATRAALE